MCAPVAVSEALTPPDSREQDAPRAGTTIVRVSDRGGFDWGDAGIGAVGGIATSLLGVGLVLLLSMNRQPQGADTQ